MKQTNKRPFSLPRFLMIAFLAILLIFVAGYLLLFQINQFSLQISLHGNAQMELTTHEAYIEPGAELRLFGTLFFREGVALDAPVNASHDIHPDKPGTYPVSYNAQWHGLMASASRSVTILDVDPPTITLGTVDGYRTIIGEAYIEEGFSAWDAVDGDLTQKVIRQETKDEVTYSVTDAAGNMTTVVRPLCYYTPEIPILALEGGDVLHIPAGTPYQEPGWKLRGAKDGVDYSVQVTGAVDHYLSGTYDLLYTLTDPDGNTAQTSRSVVVDPVAVPEIVIPEGNVIYLTFDDGPSKYTDKLLDILAKYDVKATFFLVNTGRPDTVRRIAEEGHSLAIHSVTHNYRKIYASPEAYFNDILTMQQIIYDLTGVRTYLMRFPGGSSNTVSCFNDVIMTYLTQAVEDNGFRYFDWNVASRDTGGTNSSEVVFRNVRSGILHSDCSYNIVLQHDTTLFSVNAVERIILWGLENGYTFLPLDMTSPTVHQSLQN